MGYFPSLHLTLLPPSLPPSNPRFYFLFLTLGVFAISGSTMKFIKNVPKKLFKSRKSRSVSRSETDPSSFSSQTTTSSSSDESQSGLKKPIDRLGTPTSVLPSLSSGEWSEITADVCFELKQAFEMIDREGKGKVKKEELKTLLSSIGAEPPSQDELTMMLNEVDRDGDGCISLEEFYAIGSAFGPHAWEAELRDTFDFFDSDRDGKIGAEELLNVFKTIGDSRCTLEDCRRMVSGADRNGDGFVCFEDFRRLMGQRR